MAWEFGTYIKRMMVDKGWNQEDLARATNLSPAYIGFILKGENGRDKTPPKFSLDVLIALSEALKVPEVSLIALYKGGTFEDAMAAEASYKKKDFFYERIILQVSELLKELYPDEATRTEKIIEVLRVASESR